MVQLHLNCLNDHLCHQLCLQGTSLGDKLKYELSAESEDSTLIRWKATKIAHLIAFLTTIICLTGMATWIIQITAKTMAWQIFKLIKSKGMASRIQNAQSSWDMSAVPNVPRYVRPTRISKRQAEKVLMTVNPIETRKNQGVKTKSDRMLE